MDFVFVGGREGVPVSVFVFVKDFVKLNGVALTEGVTLSVAVIVTLPDFEFDFGNVLVGVGGRLFVLVSF